MFYFLLATQGATSNSKRKCHHSFSIPKSSKIKLYPIERNSESDAQQAQEQNQTYSRRIQEQESQLQQYAQQLNKTIQNRTFNQGQSEYT